MEEQERLEQIQKAIQDLWEDAALLQLALLGAQAAIDRTTLNCLLRVSDNMKAHIRDAEGLLTGRIS